MTVRSRREFLTVGGAVLVGLGILPCRRAPAAAVEVIEMRSDALGSRVWFDPIGVQVEPGTLMRWIVRENVHNTTAYHPQNDNHSLRIPEGAVPWDSGFLVNPGDHFEVKLTVPGVYDYYCLPHEAAGMVGRIIVGRPSGPGAEPFDYWKRQPGTEDWHPMPDVARQAFPRIDRILQEHRVHPTTPGI